MEKTTVIQALQELRKEKKRNFAQSIDLILNFKHLDLKKPENHIELFLILPSGRGKENKVCALVGPELADQAEKVCNKAVQEREFEKYAKDKKITKRLANEYEFFIAQANIMPQVATAFGRIFGPRKKMPNPKAGCIVPPKGNLQAIVDKLKKTVKVVAKENAFVQVSVGTEAMKDDDLAENILYIYNQVLHKLPEERNNIKNIFIKTTMGKPQHLAV